MLRYHFEIRKKPNQLRTNLAHAWTDSLSTHFSCHCSLFFVTRALSATLQPSHCIARNSFFLGYHYISCDHMCVVTWNEIHLGHLWIFIETLQLHTSLLREIRCVQACIFSVLSSFTTVGSILFKIRSCWERISFSAFAIRALLMSREIILCSVYIRAVLMSTHLSFFRILFVFFHRWG